MKIRENGRLIKLMIGVLSVLMLTSCIREFEGLTQSNSENAMVTFAIRVPGANTPTSRALTPDQENEVTQIDVLLFEKDGGVYKERTACGSSAISTDGSDSKLKTFTIELRQGEWDLVVLANAHDMVAAASLAGKTKEAALAELKAAMPAGGKWIATSSTTGYKPFPMWGNIGNQIINADTDLTGSNRIKMTRMVARVDVQVTGTAATNFRISSVDVYNYNTQGSLVPRTTDWDATTTPTAPKALTPNIPTTSVLTKGPVVYNGLDINTFSNKCANEIYLFEAENHSDAAHSTKKSLTNRTCLVVGGIWDANADGNFTNDGAATYYRVDFADGSGASATWLDVLRNHLYTFNINSVSGYGHDTSEEAFNSEPVNIQVEVLKWNEHEFAGIVFDGQNMLGVNQGIFDFTYEKRELASTDNKLIIKTNPLINWTATVWDDLEGTTTTTSSWLTLSAYAGNGNSNSVSLLMSENKTTSERTAYVHIKVGKLEYKVKVTQEGREPYWAYIGNNETKHTNINTAYSSIVILTGSSTGIPIRTNAAKWSATIITTAGPRSIWNGTSNGTYTGTAPVNFRAPGTPGLVSASENLSNLIPSSALQKATGVYNITDGDPITVATRNRHAENYSSTEPLPGGSMKVLIHFMDADGGNTSIPDAVIDVKLLTAVKQREANSYIIPKDCIVPIAIPISQVTAGYTAARAAVGSSITVPSLTGYTASYFWGEMRHGTKDFSIIKAAGDYILVQAGDREGNFTVEMKMGSTYLWSWHIWVTESYYPYKNTDGLPKSDTRDETWMYYNLGAFNAKSSHAVTSMTSASNTSSYLDSRGLYYQWGRKDPFPMLGTTATASLTTTAQVLANPRMFAINMNTYIGTTQIFGNTNNSWGQTGGKSRFDPCPPGYRIPTEATLTGGTWNTSGVSYGRNNASRGGYYPYAGYRTTTTGILGGGTTAGYVWTATKDNYDGGRALRIHDASWPAANCCDGYSIRCVAE